MVSIAFASSAQYAGMTALQQAVGMAVAGYIDNSVLMPMLFPPDPVEGAKVGEVNVMGADHGSPSSVAYGTYAKLAGQLVWARSLQEVSVTEKVGKNGKRISYEYYVDCAVAISRTKSKPLTSLDAIFADEKCVYTNPDTVGNLTTFGGGMIFQNKGVEGNYIGFDEGVNASVVADVFDQWRVGDVFTVSNSTSNNNTFKILDKSEVLAYTITIDTDTHASLGCQNGDVDVVYTFPAFRVENTANPNTNLTTERATSSESRSYTVTATDKDDNTTTCTYTSTNTYIKGVATVITLAGGSHTSGWADGLQQSGAPVIHLGHNSSQDSLMVAREGSTNVPKYRDMAYVAFDSLDLQDFGIRIPNFEFVCSNTALANVKTVWQDILEDSELLSSEWDVSAITEDAVIGYAVHGYSEVSKKLQPLALAFRVLSQERGGVLHFFNHVATNIEDALEEDYVGAYEGESGGDGVTITQMPIDQKLGEVTVKYINSEDDGKFTEGLERAQSFSSTDIAERETPSRWTKKSVSLSPIVMKPDDAREIAHRILWSSWADDMTFEFMLPSRYIYLQENDRITIPTSGKEYTAIITKIDIGANFMVKVTAILDVSINQDFSNYGKAGA
tara:strand:+ start:2175 stop:4022 length:1848 start_codon:yes stop_codon:yes gene_type:complete